MSQSALQPHQGRDLEAGGRFGNPQFAQEADPEAHRDTPEDDGPSSFFSMENLKVAQVNIIGGTLNGYSIGFVGVYADLYRKSTQCSLYKRRESCETLSNIKCSWMGTAPNQYCGWKDRVMCSKAYNSEDSCNSDVSCHWNYKDKECNNFYGYRSLNNGIFASAMIVGCLLGSFFAGAAAERMGPKLSFVVIGVIGTVSSVLYHISTAADVFWLLCVSRLLIGVVLGLVCVACPLYTTRRACKKYSKMVGVLFQVFITLGIFLAALIGLAVGQSIHYETNSDQYVSGRMQVICAFSTLISFLMAIMGLFLGGFGIRDKQEDASRPYGDNQQDNKAHDEKQYTTLQLSFRIFVGFLVAGTLQLTGINAIMNYAPTIMDSFGLSSLVGNFIIMLWNFVTTILSIPLASILTMRQLFLSCSLLTSACCLLLCGIPVYPGVASKGVKNGVAITGILLFIAFFEFGVGPCFFVLSQDLFPPSFRPTGASYTMAAQFIFNIIINLFYPIATESISGGPSGNQDKGQAVTFIFFGCIGLVCFIVEIFFLNPWEESMEDVDRI